MVRLDCSRGAQVRVTDRCEAFVNLVRRMSQQRCR
jgi:hypothetical protein